MGQFITYLREEKGKVESPYCHHIVFLLCTCRPPLNDSPSVLSLSALLSPLQSLLFFFPPFSTTLPSRFFPFSLPFPMIRYPTHPDATNPAMPQGSGPYWTPGGHDTSSQPAVTRDPEDRHGPSRLRAANQLTSSPYASASAFSLTQRDSYPTQGQAQSECPEHFPYPHQQYIPGVNYAAPAFDLDYQVGYPLCPHDLTEYSPSSHRSIQVLPTMAGSMPPNPQQWPNSSILPQILILFTIKQHMTPRGTSLPKANIPCHQAANITKIWSQIPQAIYAVMVLLIITEPSPNIPFFPFPHHPVLLSSAMLL